MDEITSDSKSDPVLEEINSTASDDELSRDLQLDWTKELKEALESNQKFETIQRICNHKFVPDDLRADFLRLRFETKGSYVRLHEIFDLPQQSTIRSDCRQLVQGLQLDAQQQLGLTSRLESILSTFSKSHSIPYHSGNGWLEILRILLPLKLQPNEIYVVFEKILMQFVPNCFVYDSSSGKHSTNSKPFAFLRLLLQYHEPELCSFLDTRKITPDSYASSWLRSLFAAHSNIATIQSFWDVYFQVNDPFIIFYIALVMLINVKEELFKLREEPKDKVAAFLKSMPDNLQAEDIGDLFFIIHNHFIPNTPRSVQEYKELLFAKVGIPDDEDDDDDDDPNNENNVNRQKELSFESNADDFNNDLSQMLCLPVQVPFLLSCCSKPSLNSMRFFIVDCRPAEQYNNGHLNTAFHLDCSLMLQEPSSFNTAVQALLASQAQAIEVGSAAGGQHLCFLGSGREEEDRYLNMVIAFFLQKKQNYVSFVSGGYERLHKHLSDKSLLQASMVDHNRRYCLVCIKSDLVRNISSSSIANKSGGNEPYPKSGMSSSTSSSSGFFGFPTSISQTFSSLNKNFQIGMSREANKEESRRNSLKSDDPLNASAEGESLFEKMATTLKSKSAVVKEKLVDIIAQNATGSSSHKHVSSEKLGKRYNPKHFSLIEDEMNASDLENDLEIEVESWCKQNHALGYFRCQEFKDNGILYPSFLILTTTHLFIFREIPHNRGYAKIVAKRPLEMLVQITSKKKYPELLTFRYGQTSDRQEEQANIITSDHLLIPHQYEVTRLIKQQTIKILDQESNTTTLD